jgi:predicted metal-dependent phosphoesterase TrpH
MHILGYYIDTNDLTLANQLASLRQARDTRNPQIIDKLQQLGCDITLAEVEAVAGGSVVGRPHFAQVMLKKGFVATPQQAFDQYLAKGAPAYVEKARLLPQAAVAAIHRAGGVAVLAHPYQLRTTSLAALEKIVRELKEYGLDGLEVIYSRHSDQQTTDYRQLAQQYDLLITGGSDFHGVTKPDIEVGRGLGNLAVPAALLDAVKTRASQNRTQYQ